MIYLFIYLANKIPDIMLIVGTTAFVAFIASAFSGIAYLFSQDEPINNAEKEFAKLFKPAAVTCAVCIFLYMIIPSQTVMYQWAGVYVAKQINAQVHIDNKLKTISDIIDIKLEKIKKEIEK